MTTGGRQAEPPEPLPAAGTSVTDWADQAYASGREDGHAAGRLQGQDEGFWHGLDQGYASGYAQGRLDEAVARHLQLPERVQELQLLVIELRRDRRALQRRVTALEASRGVP